MSPQRLRSGWISPLVEVMRTPLFSISDSFSPSSSQELRRALYSCSSDRQEPSAHNGAVLGSIPSGSNRRKEKTMSETKEERYIQCWDPKGANELLAQAQSLVFQAQQKIDKGKKGKLGSLAQDAYRIRLEIGKLQNYLIKKEID